MPILETTGLRKQYDLGEHKLKRGDTIALQTKRGMHDFRVAAAGVDFSNQGLVVEGSWKDLDQ
jgi:hypothetical protein